MDHRTDYFWPTITDLLSEHRLFLNSRTKFNDPYDSRPIIDDDLSTSSLRQYTDEMLANPLNPRRSPSQMLRLLEMKAAGRTTLRKGSIRNIKSSVRASADEFLDSAGLLSFSLTAEHPLLWGHYAASFSGVCAVFKRGHAVESALSICANVVYVPKPPHLQLSLFHTMATARIANQKHDDLANEIFFRSFLHKSDDWRYEQEARIFYPFHALKHMPFEPGELSGFILGPKSSLSLEEKLKKEIRARKPSTALYKASLSQREYRVVLPHKFLQQPNAA